MKKSSAKKTKKKPSTKTPSRFVPEVLDGGISSSSRALRTVLALEHGVEASDRTAMALERIAGLMETHARAEGAIEDRAKADLSLSEKVPCPYCESKKSAVVMRGITVVGCMECLAPLFEATFEPKVTKKGHEMWIAGAEWAEAIMRLAQPDLTREETSDALKKEIDKKKGAMAP